MTIEQYFSPVSVEEAYALLIEHGDAYPLAGGTDLLVQSRAGRNVGTVVDLKRIPSLVSIEERGEVIAIGAATPAIEITAHPLIKAYFPGLVKATDYIGSSQIQGRCSLGGNLCNASPAADTVPALIVNDAKAVVVGVNGEKRVPIDKFTNGPGQTVLQKGEFVLSIELPIPAPNRGDAYLRFTPRTEMDIGVASAAIALTIGEGRVVKDCVVAVGAVAATALKVESAGELLNGQCVDGLDFKPFEDAVRKASSPISDKRGTAWFRKQIVGVIAVRVAKAAIENALQRGAQ